MSSGFDIVHQKRDSTVELPELPTLMLPAISELTNVMGIPRDVFAGDEEIALAWRDLPRELRQLSPDVSGELIARMCVAISAGLFDGAISYVWNATILHLRSKVRKFGLPVVAQILQKEFEEKQLLELQDSQLLELCLKLNLIDEDAYFFLDQCRDIRNNFSNAHPPMGNLNDRELLAFINRCVRYALSNSTVPQGVDISAFISAIKGPRFTDDQKDVWIERLRATHSAQRQMLIEMVHGIYCDPANAEPARLNTIDICAVLKDSFDSATRSALITRHSEYVAKGDEKRYRASQEFFERLGLISLLNEPERHAIFARAIGRLLNAHKGMNNFYNEPPFAERLRELTSQDEVPQTVQEEFVNTVLACYIGNGYGVSWAAEACYEAMIRDFSPREVAFMIRAASGNGIVARRLTAYKYCAQRFGAALRLISEETVPSSSRSEYNALLSRFPFE